MLSFVTALARNRVPLPVQIRAVAIETVFLISQKSIAMLFGFAESGLVRESLMTGRTGRNTARCGLALMTAVAGRRIFGVGRAMNLSGTEITCMGQLLVTVPAARCRTGGSAEARIMAGGTGLRVL